MPTTPHPDGPTCDEVAACLLLLVATHPLIAPHLCAPDATEAQFRRLRDACRAALDEAAVLHSETPWGLDPSGPHFAATGFALLYRRAVADAEARR